MDDFIRYKRALNCPYAGSSDEYDELEFKYLLCLGKRVEIIEINEYVYSNKNSEKLIVNGSISIYLTWGKSFRGVGDGTKYGVYKNKKDVMDDIVEYYKVKKKLLNSYKNNYENTLKYLKEMENIMKGNEEYMV